MSNESMFLTTAIHYTNGRPHIGHAYEFILADSITRWKRMCGTKVNFLTGTDEHGQKIERTANSLRMTPKAMCDMNSQIFRNLCASLNVEYTRFIRTTDEDHAKTVYDFFERCRKDIYKGEYVGWYNIREETFVSPGDAKLANYKDPVSGELLTQMKEPSYFFRLSKYQSAVKEFLITHPDFIVPASRRNEVIHRLETEELQDLSISRMTTNWGIPVPNDPEHTLYVWFDALINYVTGAKHVGAMRTGSCNSDNTTDVNQNQWPADLHIVGKDILWFHTTIWLSMLMSAELPLPKRILVHGFVCDSEGQKMSKSIGNVVDPFELIGKFPVDAVRYYFVQDSCLEGDFHFNEASMIRHHDSNLLGNLGNFVNRTFGLFHKYCDNIVPDVPVLMLFDLAKLINELNVCMIDFKLQSYCDCVFNVLTRLNTYINDTRIWQICNEKYPDDHRTEQDRQEIIRALLESMYIIAHLLYPIIPNTVFKLLKFLDEPLLSLPDLGWGTLSVSKKVQQQDTKLFAILDTTAADIRKEKHMAKHTSAKSAKSAKSTKK